MTETLDRLEQARAAARSGAWPQAYELLSEANGARLTAPEELEMLGEVAWWTGRLDESQDARIRAYSLRVERGEDGPAALLALKVSREFEHKRSPLAAAWLSRAERLLEGRDGDLAFGYLTRTRTRRAIGNAEYDEALTLADRTIELGTRHGDRNLMALGLQDKGMILVRRGEVDAGLGLLDEATVAAVSGELNPYTTAMVYCGIIATYRDLGELGRAGDWTEAAKRWCERQAISGFPGVCRVNRAEVMRLRGSWPEAEEEIHRAVEELQEFAPDVAGYAFYELGELQLRMGELDAAEQAFREAHGLGVDPYPGLALLRLARGEVDSARRGIGRALGAAPDRLARGRLLPAHVEVALAARELDEAREAAEELAKIAGEYRSPALAAWGAWAGGVVALASGDTETAHRELRRTIQLFHELETPYEAARTRLLLADAFQRDGDVDAAELELDAALATFERLGAAPDTRRTRELRGRLPRAGTDRTERAFLFTDICDSTPLVQAIGDEAWENLVAWHDRTLRALFEEHGGEEVDHAGDGFFVAFPDAKSAVACAIAVQRRLATHRRTNGFAPELRVGVHAAEASRSGAGYSGKGVHEAARIGELGGPGEITASVATAQLVDGLSYSEPETVTLKGIAEPAGVVRLNWRQ